MVSKNMRQTAQIVQVADIRKQRCANEASTARRELDLAEERLADAALVVERAQTELGRANATFGNNPSNEQLMIWRNHCAASKSKKIEKHLDTAAECTEAKEALAKKTKALQRQNLRHDHLSKVAQRQRRNFVRDQEARLDDEQQGSGQSKASSQMYKEI